MKKNVSEDLCQERSNNIEGKVDKIIDKVDHMKGNCLTTIKGKLNVLETHHGYTKEGIDNINKTITELRDLLIEKKIEQPKEKPKVDKDVVMMILKIILIFGIILYLALSGNVEKGVDVVTSMFIGG